jgi:hypothetical protein
VSTVPPQAAPCDGGFQPMSTVVAAVQGGSQHHSKFSAWIGSMRAAFTAG